MAYPFRNLVFGGGGVKGIAYVGAMGVLEQKGILQAIQRVGGTSAGAINAVLLGLNYSAAETKNILWGLNFRNFLDGSWGVVRDTSRLLSERSLRGDVYVDGAVLDNYPVKLFDREKYVDDPTHRRCPQYYADHNAALAAAGMPNSPYVYNRETLGFRLDSADEIAIFRDHAEPAQHPIDDLFSYAWALIDTVMESQSSDHLHSDDWQRTIYIDTLGVKTTDFGLDDQKKADLVQSGRRLTQNYFA